ncbi:MAG: type VI secretion system lipoprotein TssJ [Desulfovibrio sp.]|jgi:type VI secretion system VasD/TssJ family lipoprotein|nr:type VI secretion system lipoprotein TssJ [Desulfovibrio sp.]
MKQAYTKRRPLSTGGLPGAAGLLLAMLLCAAVSACGGGGPPPKPTPQSEDPTNVLWGYGEKAITLRFQAAKDVNTFEDKPHTIQLCVYQLDEQNAFNQTRGTQDGISALLQCTAFDKTVKSVTRFFLQPSEMAAYTLDRAEGALFVGIVCGYFDSTPEQSAKLWQIPLSQEQSGHLFWKKNIYSAGGLDLRLHLSARALEEDNEVKAKDKPRTEAKELTK